MGDPVKKAMVINDLSGLGRCSLTAAIPVLSVLGIQPCPVPTAVLSNQTGYDSYFLFDCAEAMRAFPREWQKRGFRPDGICTGYFSSAEQIRAAQTLIDAFRTPETLLLIDPVMGDHGHRYTGFSPPFCAALAAFSAQADVLTPNITEACLLTDTDYAAFAAAPEAVQRALLERMAEALPAPTVVITGWRREEKMSSAAWQNGSFEVYESPSVDGSFSGTGDLFAAALAGGLLRGDSLETAVRRAMRFLDRALADAKAAGAFGPDGIPFEPHLRELLL
ncbi:MAG: pyridoxamine kinase [Oscillospiraceae bacterium]|nr:pyridoxamine kinase [Oscillospiraceae bacterium]